MADNAGVFVSYASADRDRIEPVVEALEERGVHCWFDVRNLQPFDSKLTARIANGIADTAVTLAFMSDAYQASEACRWELLRTLQTNGQQDLLLVTLAPSPVMWSAVTENVFFDLTQGTPRAAASLAEKIAGHVHGRPPRGAPSEYAWWWPQEWAGSGFEGRFDERLKLISLLTPHIGKHNDHRASRQVQIVGLGGQGKTMLALQSARDLAWYYPGGCAIFDAGGDRAAGIVTNPATTLDQLLGQVHDWANEAAAKINASITLPARDAPRAWSETGQAVQSLLASTGRALWLIDDLPAGMSESDLNNLFCPSPGDTLITTRTDHYSLVVQQVVELEALAPDEALYLLAGGSAESMERDQANLRKIAAQVGHHALALAVLQPRLAGSSARHVLDALVASPVVELEDCARDIGGLPAGHGSSIVATLQMSIEGLAREEALDLMRIAAMWPSGQSMEVDMLRAVLGDRKARGACTELVRAKLGRRDGEQETLTVHALVASVGAWLIANAPGSRLGDAARERDLRSAAALWLEERADTAPDAWTAAEVSRSAWHLLEPVRWDFRDGERHAATRSLMAMARLRMRHKPSGVTGEALIEHLESAILWARTAEDLWPEETRDAVLHRGRAIAMRGLLELSIAGLTHGDVALQHARSGRALLEESVNLREPLLRGSNAPCDQDELGKAYFNFGRLTALAKVLAASGQHDEARELLDAAERAYVRVGEIRRQDLPANPTLESREDLASCYRGEAIVALTRVTHQAGLDRAERLSCLAFATDRLALAMNLTTVDDGGTASADMCKDMQIAIKVDVLTRVLSHEMQNLRRIRELVDALQQEIPQTEVPWTCRGGEQVNAALGFARLRVNSERGGSGVTFETVARELCESDCPALLRTLAITS